MSESPGWLFQVKVPDTVFVILQHINLTEITTFKPFIKKIVECIWVYNVWLGIMSFHNVRGTPSPCNLLFDLWLDKCLLSSYFSLVIM